MQQMKSRTLLSQCGGLVKTTCFLGVTPLWHEDYAWHFLRS